MMTRNPSVRGRVWQGVRILRQFSRDELTAVAEASRNTVRVYLCALVKAGILRRRGGHYQMVRDLGPKPPQLCFRSAGKSGLTGLYDPNEERRYELA